MEAKVLVGFELVGWNIKRHFKELTISSYSGEFLELRKPLITCMALTPNYLETPMV